MAENIQLRVITPHELVVDEQVDEVVGPGTLGEFGILPGHVPFISTLFPGFLKYKVGSEQKSLIVHGGLAEVREDTVRILTDGAEQPGEADQAEAKKEIDQIEQELKDHTGSPKKQQELNFRLKLAQARASADKT